MKYLFLSAIIALTGFTPANAETDPVAKAELLDSVTVLQPILYGKQGEYKKVDTAWLKFHPVGKISGDDTTIELALLAFSMPGNPSLVDKKIVITKDAWNKNQNIIKPIRVMVDNVTVAITHDEVAHIIIKDNPDQYTTLRLSKNGMYDGTKPFWVEFGGNFDIADRKFSNVFGGIFLYKRDWRKTGKNHEPNLALAAGVYESKVSAQKFNSPSFSIQPYINNNSFVTSKPDSAFVFTDTGTLEIKSTIQNIGLFVSPQLRLTNGSSNEDGLHLFVSYYAEMLWQHVTTEYNYEGMFRADTLGILRKDVGSYTTRPQNREHNFYTHYQGIGLPVFAKYEDAQLYINPVIGFSNQPTDSLASKSFLYKDENSSSNNIITREWHPFYVVQFRLSDQKYGLTFSGEVRQLINAKSAPYVTLVLSKKFDIMKLIEFF